MTSAIQFHNIHFDPLISVEWLIALAAIAFVLSVFGIWRRGRGAVFRLILLSSLILLLAKPSLVSETRNYLDDIALVIIDETDSQKIGDRAAQTRKAAQSVLAKLQAFENMDIRTVSVKNQAITATGNNDGTRLFDARDSAVKSIPRTQLAATILITDGQVHDAPSKVTPSLKDAGPVHVVLTGQEGEIDRVLVIERSPPYGIVNKSVTVKLKVIDQGDKSPPKTTMVTAILDGQIIQRAAVLTAESSEIEVSIAHGGQNFLEIRVEQLAGEISTKNNVAFLTINGIRDRLKVLLVSGEPHMGERGWRNILKSDPSVDLVHFTILRPPEKQDGTPINELSLIPFPIAELFEAKLNEFDLIIFDRYRRRGVLAPIYLRNIVKYVENGGALLEAAGPSFATPLSLYRTPLSVVLPGRPTGHVFEQGFVPALSEQGKRHPVTAKLSPDDTADRWGRWFRMIDTDSTAGHTLMTGPEKRPLLILQRQKEGRVAQLMSDQAWLWGRGFEGGGPQAELLRRISHWLMKEPELEEEQLAGEVAGDRLLIKKQSLDERNEPVTVTDPDGNESTLLLPSLTAGFQQGSIGLSGMGLYKLSSGEMSSMVAVGPLNPTESKDVRSTKKHIAAIVEGTGGKIHRMSAATLPDFKRTSPTGVQATKFWFGLRSNRNYEITGYTRIAFVPPLLALFLTLGALCLSWWRESR